jgi:NTP pyrophosphatase (non-canonical NTP hydrolase)
MWRCILTPNEYQKLAELTENQDFDDILVRLSNDQTIRLLHAAQGLTTEAGEFADVLKKWIFYGFYGKVLDQVNLVEELGDLLWYIACAANALNVNLEDVMSRNIEKLKTRYPSKFTAEAALRRDLEAERRILEK